VCGFRMMLAGNHHPQQQIADAVGMDQANVTRQIADIMQNGKYSDLHIFRDFEQSDSHRLLDIGLYLLITTGWAKVDLPNDFALPVGFLASTQQLRYLKLSRPCDASL